jgi:TonB family protein
MDDTIELRGTSCVEVIAQFDGAIVNVTHVRARDSVDDDANTRHARRTRYLLGGGFSALAFALGSFVLAYFGVSLARAIDVLVALALSGGTAAIAWGLARRAERLPHDFTIGTDRAVDFALPAGTVPLARFPLVRVDEAGDFELTVADGMAGTFSVDGQSCPLEGITRRSTLVGGARVTRLVAGARAVIKLAPHASVHVANVPAPRRQPRPLAIDWAREVYLGGVGLVVSAFLFLLYSVPPEPRALSLDLLHNDHYARFSLRPPAEPTAPSLPADGQQGGAPGAARSGEPGRLGKRDALHRTGTLQLPGPASREKRLAAVHDAVANSAILSILRAHDGTHGGVLFGPDRALGDGAAEVLAGLQSTELRDGYGSGATLLGSGPGGGGDNPATIGVGRLGTIGLCDGCKGGARGYARSAPTGALVHRAHAPDVVPGAASVRCGFAGGALGACLDKEIIRRVVRQHRNEVRFCYERALLMHAELTGRVVIQFTIAGSGRVLGSAVSESSLGHRDAETCIADAVRRWEFPSSSQTSIVSYPFVLAPPR